MKLKLGRHDIPLQKKLLLKEGDTIYCDLPGKQFCKLVAVKEQFPGAAEQTTACGIYLYEREPDFAQLKHYLVSTSADEEVSIYSFEIGDYYIEYAQDLRRREDLAVILHIALASDLAPFAVNGGSDRGMSHEEARRLFDKKQGFMPVSSEIDGQRGTGR
jgi:hypothetical protein